MRPALTAAYHSLPVTQHALLALMLTFMVVAGCTDPAGPDHREQAGDPERWQPTLPAYMDGIELHWKKLPTFAMDSAKQFSPAPPDPHDMPPAVLSMNR